MSEVIIYNARPEDAEAICRIGGYFPAGRKAPPRKTFVITSGSFQKGNWLQC